LHPSSSTILWVRPVCELLHNTRPLGLQDSLFDPLWQFAPMICLPGPLRSSASSELD